MFAKFPLNFRNRKEYSVIEVFITSIQFIFFNSLFTPTPPAARALLVRVVEVEERQARGDARDLPGHLHLAVQRALALSSRNPLSFCSLTYVMLFALFYLNKFYQLVCSERAATSLRGGSSGARCGSSDRCPA